MTSKTKTMSRTTAVLDASRIAPAILAILVGSFLVVGVGFAQSNTIHNAAHDARHAFAFPCH